MLIIRSFNYTYPSGYGVVETPPIIMRLNFSKYEGHGVALRANVDFPMIEEYKSIRFRLESDGIVKLRVEFKTEESCGCAQSEFYLETKNGEEYVSLTFPKLLSPLKEICIVALKSDNTYATANYYKVSHINIE